MTVVHYPYFGADGNLLYEVVRTDDPGQRKTFRPRRPVADGWVNNLEGVERVPYALPLLIEAAEKGGSAILVEGEKCADRLGEELAGPELVATTWHGGSGWKWPPEWAEHFRGLGTVYLVADNDNHGRAAMQRIGEQLMAVVADVRIVDALPGVPPKGDVVDFFDAGGSIDSLLRILDSGRPPKVDDSPAGMLRRMVLTFDDLENIPPPVWLVDDFLHENTIAAVVGKPNAGKSFLTLDLALSIATGQSWHGRRVRRGAVLYCIGEGLSGMRIRTRAWARYHHYDTIDDTFWLPRAVNLLDANWSGALVTVAEEIHPKMVVLDTLARHAPGAAENSPEDMGRVVEAADRLRRSTGATVVLVHHVDKVRGETRGHSSLEGAIDTTVKVESAGALITISNPKQKESTHFSDFHLSLRPVGDSAVVTDLRAGH